MSGGAFEDLPRKPTNVERKKPRWSGDRPVYLVKWTNGYQTETAVFVEADDGIVELDDWSIWVPSDALVATAKCLIREHGLDVVRDEEGAVVAELTTGESYLG